MGPSIAADLRRLGIDRPSCFKGKSPLRLYEKLCRLEGKRLDRCLLYTFRCAAYAATTRRPSPKLLKWWNWKDRPFPDE